MILQVGIDKKTGTKCMPILDSTLTYFSKMKSNLSIWPVSKYPAL